VPSYSPVFSSALVQYTASTPNAQFEVPSGFTAVVRQISVVQDVGGYDAGVYIQDSAEAPGLLIAQAIGVDIYEVWQQEGRWVVTEGGFVTLSLSTVGSQAYGYVGGYLLRNTLT
jgi:hypothetical protein